MTPEEMEEEISSEDTAQTVSTTRKRENMTERAMMENGREKRK